MFVSSVLIKKNPLKLSDIFSFFFTNGGEFLVDFLHTYYTFLYTRLQIFIHLSPTLTKLCHNKRDNLVYIICSKCPPSAETHVFRRLRKSLITLLIVDCASHYKINTFIMSSNV